MAKLKNILSLSIAAISLGTVFAGGAYATEQNIEKSYEKRGNIEGTNSIKQKEVENKLITFRSEFQEILSRRSDIKNKEIFLRNYISSRFRGFDQITSEFIAKKNDSDFSSFQKEICLKAIKSGHSDEYAELYALNYVNSIANGNGLKRSTELAKEATDSLYRQQPTVIRIKSSEELKSDLYNKALERYKDKGKATTYVNEYIYFMSQGNLKRISDVYADQIVKGRNEREAEKFAINYLYGIRLFSNKTKAEEFARQTVENNRNYKQSLEYVRTYFKNVLGGMGEVHARKAAEKVAVDIEKAEKEYEMPALESNGSYCDPKEEEEILYRDLISAGKNEKEASAYVKAYMKMQRLGFSEEFANIYADKILKGFSEKDALEYMHVYINELNEGNSPEAAHASARRALVGKMRKKLKSDTNVDEDYKIMDIQSIHRASDEAIFEQLEKGSTFTEANKYVRSLI